MELKKLFVTLLLLCSSVEVLLANISSNLPETELSWKNVATGIRTSTTYSIHIDNRGLVWIGTNSGLYFYDGTATRPVKNERLSGAQIYAMAEHDDNLYLGTNHGLLVMSLTTGEISAFKPGFPKEIRCLLITDNVLWVGSLYGVYYANLNNEGSIARASGLPHSSAYSMVRDSRGIIYVGTFNGLAKWDSVKKKFLRINSQPEPHKGQNLFVNCILESEDGNFLYVGCEGNLYKYHIAADRWDSERELEGNNIKSLTRIGDGHILIGTDNGIYDSHLDTIKHYRHDSRQSNSLADNDIWCLLADKDRNVWAGHGRGFSISSHSNTMRALKLSTIAKTGDGNEIYSILRDRNGNLWLGGTNGVLRISTEKNTVWYRHDNSAGSLSHNRIRAIDEDSRGCLWLSTDAGLNRFDPVRGCFDAFHVMDSSSNHNSNWVYAFEEDENS